MKDKKKKYTDTGIEIKHVYTSDDLTPTPD